MNYQGGKFRIAKYLVPLMESVRKPGQTWVEPFVGGGNVISIASGARIGSDLNPHTIQALLDIRDHAEELPHDGTEFTERDYADKAHRFYSFAHFAYSFGAVFKGGWARNDRGTDYVEQAYRGAQKQSPGLQGVNLICCPYYALDIPPDSLIYCDPPYAGTTGYSGAGKFDSVAFWGWCRFTQAIGHTVFISEYKAPDDFIPVWEREVARCLRKANDTTKPVEKLFIQKA